MEYIISSIDELYNWAGTFIKNLKQKKQATIITLSGDLGAGKTTLVGQIAKHLGITESVTSPTFVIQKEYIIEHHDWIKRLIHIDAYRLEDKKDLEYLGWNKLLVDPHTLIIMEWPEIVEGIKFPEKNSITITINPDHSRKFIVN